MLYRTTEVTGTLGEALYFIGLQTLQELWGKPYTLQDYRGYMNFGGSPILYRTTEVTGTLGEALYFTGLQRLQELWGKP